MICRVENRGPVGKGKEAVEPAGLRPSSRSVVVVVLVTTIIWHDYDVHKIVMA